MLAQVPRFNILVRIDLHRPVTNDQNCISPRSGGSQRLSAMASVWANTESLEQQYLRQRRAGSRAFIQGQCMNVLRRSIEEQLNTSYWTSASNTSIRNDRPVRWPAKKIRPTVSRQYRAALRLAVQPNGWKVQMQTATMQSHIKPLSQALNERLGVQIRNGSNSNGHDDRLFWQHNRGGPTISPAILLRRLDWTIATWPADSIDRLTYRRFLEFWIWT